MRLPHLVCQGTLEYRKECLTHSKIIYLKQTSYLPTYYNVFLGAWQSFVCINQLQAIYYITHKYHIQPYIQILEYPLNHYPSRRKNNNNYDSLLISYWSLVLLKTCDTPPLIVWRDKSMRSQPCAVIMPKATRLN